MCCSAAHAAGRCAYVDVNSMLFGEPQEHCVNLDKTCSDDEAPHGCFKSALEFKPGWVTATGASRRQRELAAPFGYIDPDGLHWDVPAGFLTDGASIPLFFQALIGGPWTENYVKAAVVHDFYIRRKSVSAAAVHEVFYKALIAGGTKLSRAKQMFEAVSLFGPQWKHMDIDAYTRAWQQRKAMNDELIRIHKAMWDAFQESERRREAQAAIDRATIALPIEQRTRVFRVPGPGDWLIAFDAFIDATARDNIVNVDRDQTLITSLRDQITAELAKPDAERNNVFVLQFTKLGAQFTSFQARSEAEFEQMLKLTNEISAQMEGP